MVAILKSVIIFQHRASHLCFALSPENHVAHPPLITEHCMVSRPQDHTQNWGLLTPTYQQAQRNMEKVKVENFIDKVRNLMRWNNFSFLVVAWPRIYLIMFFTGITSFLKSCKLWLVTDRIVIHRPTRGKMPPQLSPIQYALTRLDGNLF